ncbi:DNA-binding CsgD family transcriptional regulator [Limimaricola variabilis]|uniref:DNA-binding CsgD family transcriptional regulator n=1 Tax=Limimaricola variabilis TaxID=1492771 RepID=A0ABR6HRJ1_9RHOB|nr:helix-turn-helix transcriptional regulator [Limimaricola variabilis]MBB3713009.1 DNA-binding CsgD family transcriptional regulator [Limimaricola variabilis]
MKNMLKADRLRSLVYGAVLGENDWQAFLTELTALLPEGRATLFFHDIDRQAGAFSLASNLTSEKTLAYNAHYAPKNPWMKGASKRPVGLVVPDQYMLSRAELEKTEFYCDWLHPQGLKGAIGVTLHREGGHNSLLSVISCEPDVHEHQDALRDLQHVVPDLQKVMDFYRRQASKPPVSEGGVGSDACLVTVGRNRIVRYMNSAAQRLLENSTELALSPTSRLRCIDNNLMEWIDFCLALWGRSNFTFPTRSFLVGRPPAPPTRVTVICVAYDMGEQFFRGPECHLIIEPSRTEVRSFAAISRFYQLTPMESKVCALLSAGAAPAEIAERLGVGIATIRSHLKSVYYKTGTTRQAEVVSLVCQFADR